MTMNLLPLSQRAWLAGFIDGDGFIGITFQRKKANKQQSSTPRYHPFLIITNRNKKAILHIKNIIGEGRIYQFRRKSNTSHSPIFQYKLSKMEALANLLEKIKPYLKIKHLQCDLLLRYIKIRQKRPIVTGKGSRGVTSFSAEEEAIYQKLLFLNKRGGSNEASTS